MAERRRAGIKQQTGKSWGQRIIQFFLTVGIGLVIFSTWLWVHPQRSTIAIIGTDSTVTEDSPRMRRSDALLIVTAANDPPQIGMMSMPRDLLMRLPDGEYNRLNAAYANGGSALTIETVRRNVGLQVFSYARFDYGDVRGFIDALGGIEVEVKVPIGKAYPKGRYKLDGAKALTFIRTRAGSDDFGRTRRLQQVVLPAIVRRLKEEPAAWIGAAQFGIRYLVAGDHEGLIGSLPLFTVAAIRTPEVDRFTFSYATAKPVQIASLQNAKVLCLNWQTAEPRLKKMFGSALLSIHPRPHPKCRI